MVGPFLLKDSYSYTFLYVRENTCVSKEISSSLLILQKLFFFTPLLWKPYTFTSLSSRLTLNGAIYEVWSRTLTRHYKGTLHGSSDFRDKTITTTTSILLSSASKLKEQGTSQNDNPNHYCPSSPPVSVPWVIPCPPKLMTVTSRTPYPWFPDQGSLSGLPSRPSQHLRHNSSSPTHSLHP